MSEIKEYIIKSEGVKLRTVTEQDININSAIVEHFSASVTRKTPLVFPMKLIWPEALGHAALTVASGNVTIWSLRIHKLPLKTHYQSKDGILWPVFDDSTSPVLALDWQVPDSMKLVLAVTLDRTFQSVQQHLVAFDELGRTYRLPVSNLYADLKLCFGKYPAKPADQMEALVLAVNQFMVGQWNADLYEADATKRKNTKALFSFRAEKDSFPQQPVPENWTAHAEKVSNDFVTQNIQPTT